ncbi:MAG TPA: class I SAM-dependent methyltransferase [Bryobacteraceae bacterium]|nr:class I SAM-dependent methyltransferase [Bryobacteraceae bacterium]
MSFWLRSRRALARAWNVPLGHSQDRYFDALKRCVRPGARWLDIGCGRQVVPSWAAPEEAQRALVASARCLIGMDVDRALYEHPLVQHRVMGWGDQLPFADGSLDLITANMVVEHLKDPARVFAEAWRALRPGGVFLFHTPNRLNPYVMAARFTPEVLKKKLVRMLDERDEADTFKTYYRANSTKRIESLARETRFRAVETSIGGSVGQFQDMGPLAVLELPFLKLLSVPPFQRLDFTIIAVLEKPKQATA